MRALPLFSSEVDAARGRRAFVVPVVDGRFEVKSFVVDAASVIPFPRGTGVSEDGRPSELACISQAIRSAATLEERTRPASHPGHRTLMRLAHGGQFASAEAYAMCVGISLPSASQVVLRYFERSR